MTKEEIENIDVTLFEDKVVVMSADDYTKFWLYIEQLQQENEELKAIDKAHQELVGELMCNKGMVGR